MLGTIEPTTHDHDHLCLALVFEGELGPAFEFVRARGCGFVVHQRDEIHNTFAAPS